MSRFIKFSRVKSPFLIFLVCVLGPNSAWSLSEEKIKSLENKLMAQINASQVKPSEVGLSVAHVGLDKSQVWFSHQADKSFVPASVTKIIPAVAALKILGPTHRFETALLSAAKVESQTLKGDLILRGGGDPGFVTETLWVLVNEFHRSGIKKVDGSIIVDDSLFDEVRFDPSRDDSRVDRAYDAPVGAMSFNWNSVNVYIRPGLKVGSSAEVHADPENELVVVENKVTTTSGRRSNVWVKRTSLSQGKEKLTVGGAIGISAEEKVVYKNVTHPALWSGANLKSAMLIRGIEVTGGVKRGKTPAQARVIADVESKAVSHVVQDMMKYSNNYVAEMLTKHLALASGQPQGNMSEGIKVLRTFVSSTGADKKNFVLNNPSGLTQDNKFRPEDIVRLLGSIQNDFRIQAEVMASFPLSGLDGTMKSRLKDYPSQVRAKTGLLNGVVGLAGWVENKEGPLAFCFFFNGRPSREVSAKDLFDQLLKTLVEWE